MLPTTMLYKAVLIIDTAIEHRVLKAIRQMGATGYTCLACFGEGPRTIQNEPFMGSTQIQVEVVASRKIVEDLVALVESSTFGSSSRTAYIETVEVMNPEKFLGQVSVAAT